VSPGEFDSHAKPRVAACRRATAFPFPRKASKISARARARARTHALRIASRDDRTANSISPFRGRRRRSRGGRGYNRTDIFRLNIIKFTREGTRGRTRDEGREGGGRKREEAFTRNGRSKFSLAARSRSREIRATSFPPFRSQRKNTRLASRARDYLITTIVNNENVFQRG
jgi:hypothetical protein